MPACLPLVSFFTGFERADMNTQQWSNFWHGMRSSDFMLVDAPSRKIAIFPNESGQVVIATQDGEEQCVTNICCDEIEDLERLFAAAARVAKGIDVEREAEYAIWRAQRFSVENGRG